MTILQTGKPRLREGKHAQLGSCRAELKARQSRCRVCKTSPPPQPPRSPGHQPIHLRLEVLIYEDVIAVQLKAVLVADDHLCTLCRLLMKMLSMSLKSVYVRPVLGRQVLPEALQHPLAALGPTTRLREETLISPDLASPGRPFTISTDLSLGQGEPALSPVMSRTLTGQRI